MNIAAKLVEGEGQPATDVTAVEGGVEAVEGVEGASMVKEGEDDRKISAIEPESEAKVEGPTTK